MHWRNLQQLVMVGDHRKKPGGKIKRCYIAITSDLGNSEPNRDFLPGDLTRKKNIQAQVARGVELPPRVQPGNQW